MAGTEAPSRAFQRRVLIQSGLIAGLAGLAAGGLVAWGLRPSVRPSPGAVAADAPAESKPGVLRTSRLELIDETGKLRGLLLATARGVSMRLDAPDRKQSVSLFADAGNAGVQLFGDGGVLRGGLQLGDEGPRLTLNDAAEKPRMNLSLQPDGWSRINLLGESGGGLNLGTSGDEMSTLSILDPRVDDKGMRVARLGAMLSRKREMSFWIKGNTEYSGLFYGVDGDGKPSYALFDQFGTRVAPDPVHREDFNPPARRR